MSKRDHSYRNGAFCPVSLQQCHLSARRTERRAIQVKPFPPVEPQPLDGFTEALRQQVGKRPFATHAYAEAA